MYTLDKVMDLTHPWDLTITIDGEDFVTRPMTLADLAAVGAAARGLSQTVTGKDLLAIVAALFEAPRPELRSTEQAVGIVRAMLAYIGVQAGGGSSAGGEQTMTLGEVDEDDSRDNIHVIISALCMAYPALTPDAAAGMRLDVAYALLAARTKLMQRANAPGREGVLYDEARHYGDRSEVPIKGLDGLKDFLRNQGGRAAG